MLFILSKKHGLEINYKVFMYWELSGVAMASFERSVHCIGLRAYFGRIPPINSHPLKIISKIEEYNMSAQIPLRASKLLSYRLFEKRVFGGLVSHYPTFK